MRSQCPHVSEYITGVSLTYFCPDAHLHPKGCTDMVWWAQFLNSYNVHLNFSNLVISADAAGLPLVVNKCLASPPGG